MGWGAIGLVVGALLTGLFGWLAQRSKSDSDVEVAVLAEWQKLNAALSDRLSAVEKEFADYRNKMSAELEKLRGKHRAEMRALRDLNEGLQRQIAQNSQSAAHLFGNAPNTKKDGGDDG